MGYCLSITENQFFKLKKENNIDSDSDGNLFINVVYDEELGLLLSKEESNIL